MEHNDHLIRVSAMDGRVRALAVDATGAVAKLAEVHGTAPAATAALGRVATGALLLGALLKQEQHLVTLRVRGDGPAGTVLASANGRGDVRGLIGNPRPDIEQVRDGKLNVSEAVGRHGHLTVVRDMGLRQPYNSTVELVSGEIGQDLAYYFARSEQTPSALGVGVFVAGTGAVDAAGGYLIQLLGGLKDDEIEEMEAEIAALPHPTTMLRAGETPEQILSRVFGGGFQVLHRGPVRFYCPCDRDRAERALRLLGGGALEELRQDEEERGYSDVVCEFCRTSYRFTLQDIDRLIEEAA
ncbi:MAG: Hsp33 family molecular chaperone HslO [Gemmatimonadota bacterium]